MDKSKRKRPNPNYLYPDEMKEMMKLIMKDHTKNIFMTDKEVLERAEGGVVIVIDNGNYKSSYAEKTPFKAHFNTLTDYPCCIVTSLSSGKEYELYPNQILEFMNQDQIENLIDIKKYGEI
jgi:hypothetical protein